MSMVSLAILIMTKKRNLATDPHGPTRTNHRPTWPVIHVMPFGQYWEYYCEVSSYETTHFFAKRLHHLFGQACPLSRAQARQTGRPNKLSVYVCVCLWLVNYAKIRIADHGYDSCKIYETGIKGSSKSQAKG